MNLPFSSDQFFHVFREYNETVWPAQILLLALAIIAIVLTILLYRNAHATIGMILTFLWLWMGLVYHILFFTSINPAAYLFGALFILQGFLFFWFIVFKKKISFKWQWKAPGITGVILILFALLIYPLIGRTQGHLYPSSPTFGLPCPTTIFTFGLLLFSTKKLPLVIFIIPLLWSIIGFTASFTMGIKEDIGLIISGAIFMAFHLFSKRVQ